MSFIGLQLLPQLLNVLLQLRAKKSVRPCVRDETGGGGGVRPAPCLSYGLAPTP